MSQGARFMYPIIDEILQVDWLRGSIAQAYPDLDQVTVKALAERAFDNRYAAARRNRQSHGAIVAAFSSPEGGAQ